MAKNPSANAEDAGDMGSIPRLVQSPGDGSGEPLQYYCLKNSMDRGAWQATIHRVAESDTTQRLSTHITQSKVIFVVLIFPM